MRNRPISLRCGRMRIVFMIVALLSCHGSLFASYRVTRNCDFEDNGIYYRKLDASSVAVTSKTYSYLVVTPEGGNDYFDHYLYESGYSGKVVIPESVAHDGTTYMVSSIDDYAFRNGRYDLDDGSDYTIEITSISIPKTVASLAQSTFYCASKLDSVYVSWETPVAIGQYVFYDPSYTELTLCVPYGCKSAYEKASIWSGFKEIVEYGKEIQFEDDRVKAICVENWDVNGNGELDYDEAASVSSIGSCFKGNGEITSFNELEYFTGISALESYAFMGCTNLQSCKIPNTVTTIPVGLFSRCSNLSRVVLPASVTKIEHTAFNECESLEDLVLPEGLMELGQNAIQLCSSLTTVEVPKGVRTLPWAVFNKCSSLHSVVLHEGLERIEGGAFLDCEALTAIAIPSTVTSIGDYSYDAFSGCNALTSVTICSMEPITISGNVFSNRANATLYVPFSCKAKYEGADYWREFKQIVEMERPIGDVNGDGEVNIEDVTALVNMILSKE